MKTRVSQNAGFTLVEIMIVVAIVGLLCAIAIPNFVHARQNSQVNVCINNLRQIDSAIQQFALETGAGTLSPVTGDDIAPYLPRGVNVTIDDIENRVYCPVDQSRAFSSSYAAGLSTVDDKPVCVIGGGLSPAHLLP